MLSTSLKSHTQVNFYDSRRSVRHPQSQVPRPLLLSYHKTWFQASQVLFHRPCFKGWRPRTGIIPREQVQNFDPAATVQGSVAHVFQDLTGEGHTFTSISGGPETDHRPDKIHTFISVPLSSRVKDNIQSKIWANEYIDLGTLLYRTISSLPGDPRYNFPTSLWSVSSPSKTLST